MEMMKWILLAAPAGLKAGSQGFPMYLLLTSM
jgi:hypothetical protein